MATFAHLLNVSQRMSKKCARIGCDEVFIHGRTIEYGPEMLCMNCSDAFIKIIDDDEQPGCEYDQRARKYVEQDLRNFMQTTKGETIIPSKIAEQDKQISAHSVFYKKRVEILDPEPTV